jgi:predicted Zn-dependent protease
VPPAWRFGGGPSVSHLVVAPGEATDDELLAACGTGIYVQRVDYLRVVQPKQTLATGSSRDGTLWIENGRVVARLPQFRFTVRLADVLRAVELVGARRERSEIVFCESLVTPGAVVSSFPVDALTGL